MSNTATIRLAVESILTAIGALVTGRSPLTRDLTYSFTDGVGANQVKETYSDERTLAASASENLDLSGVLLDQFGAVIAFAKIKALLIEADAANTNDVQVSSPAVNGWAAPWLALGNGIAIKPGGLLLLVAPDLNGYGVVAATGDLLHVANSGAGTSVKYRIVVLGTV